MTIVLSVNASAFSNAPKFDQTMLGSGSSSSSSSSGSSASASATGTPSASGSSSSNNPFSSVDQYWASNGLTIPATGASTAPAMSNPILVRGTLGTVNVTGTGGTTVGNVRDFVVDMMTGQIVYAVLSGGSFGNNYVVVPMSQFQYTSAQGSTGTLGSFTTTVPNNVFQGAPTVSSMNQLNLNQSGWNTQYDQYWNQQK